MKRQVLFATFLSGICFHAVIGQANVPASSTQSNASNHHARLQYGTASFYADKFNGRRTANGEIFSQKKMTAASNTVPLNTWVKVTNLHNKKSVIVRVTDRMHYSNKRLIDLSKAAASKLSYTGRGLTRVRVEVLGKKKPKVQALAKSEK